jgi:hypothetical protein
MNKTVDKEYLNKCLKEARKRARKRGLLDTTHASKLARQKAKKTGFRKKTHKIKVIRRPDGDASFKVVSLERGPGTKVPTCFRLDPEIVKLLDKGSRKSKKTKTALVEESLRSYLFDLF